MAATKKAAEPDKPPPEKTTAKKERDLWAEACPVCGLLGCRRHT